MTFLRVARFFGVLALAAAAGCGEPPPGASPMGETSSGAPATCERTCNASYDSCMDRFSGVGGSGPGIGGVNDPSKALGPNDVCPDQLKSCLRSCLN